LNIDELREKLEALIASLPPSGYDAVSDETAAGFLALAPVAAELGMQNGKKLLENLATVLKARKGGASSDDSVSVRLTALDFYVKNLQSGSTEEL
jgi:hypothetical protein